MTSPFPSVLTQPELGKVYRLLCPGSPSRLLVRQGFKGPPYDLYEGFSSARSATWSADPG